MKDLTPVIERAKEEEQTRKSELKTAVSNTVAIDKVLRKISLLREKKT